MKHTLTLNDEQMRTIHAALVEYKQALIASDCATTEEIERVSTLIVDTDI